MKLSTIHSGLFKLDGGAMFGVVPKQLWKRLNPPDDNNMCTWAMKCLLLEKDGKKILFDTGMGEKQDEKFRSHFEPHGPYHLLSSLEDHGVGADQVTDVFITHLHFDHCGGAVAKEGDRLYPTFGNATYWSNRTHLEWAREPNARERASFLKENFVPLEDEGVLKHLPEKRLQAFSDDIDVLMVDGHTEKMMIPHIRIGERTLVFCADLLPSAYHLGLPYVMAYDVRPLVTLEEKSAFLEEAYKNEYVLFLEHDPVHECITITKNERGKYVVKASGSLADFFPDNV
jgi:glyoxylase-like metal-dependent hydrolase (beta-lactamase superfamily II)